MKKNSRGFTLVELLVVIAIMGSILVLAITSLNSISKAKKKEAKKKVENQIELAAKQYFEANEYLFEWLTIDTAGTNSYDTIPLKKLVENDYINTLTNPVTGKKYGECSYVKVYKTKNNKYELEFIDENTGCRTEKVLVLNEEGSPKLEYIAEGDTIGDNSWYRSNVKETATATIGKGGIESIELYSDEYCSTQINDLLPENVQNGKKIEYENSTSNKKGYIHCAKAKTYSGKELKLTVNYKIDKENPVATIEDSDGYITTGDPDKWINKTAVSTNSNILKYNLVTDDLHSGINEEKFKKDLEVSDYNFSYSLSFENKDNASAKKTIKIYDMAGNTESVTAKAKIDVTPPEITTDSNTYTFCKDTSKIVIQSVNNRSGSDNNVIGLKVKDSTSGVDYISVDGVKINQNSSLSDFDITGKNSLKIEAIDVAGNSSTKTVNIARKECTTPIPTPPKYPKLNIKIYKRDKNGNSTDNVYNETVEGTSDNTPIVVKINNGNWVNMYNYPYGVNIVYTPVDENIKSAKWYENKSQLNKKDSESNTYKWGGNTTGYKGTSSASIINDGSVTMNTSKSHKLDDDGYREGRIYATNENGLTTIVLVKIAKDSTGPKLRKGVSPVLQTNQNTCRGLSTKTKYSYIYTSFNVFDTLSGINTITHYIDGYDDNNNNTKNFYYKNTDKNGKQLNGIYGGFIPVENGVAKVKGNVNFDYVKPNEKNSEDFNPIEAFTGGFTIRRAWADVNNSSDKNTNIKTARELGCGTVGNETPEIEKSWMNCNYLTVSDNAGNKLTARICAYKPKRSYADIYTYARNSTELGIYGIVNINSCSEHSLCN